MDLPRFDALALFVARTTQGLSRAELAALSGVSDETIRRSEISQTVPEVRSIVALARALGLNPLDLYTPTVQQGESAA